MEKKTIAKVGMAALIAMLESATSVEAITAALESDTMYEIAQCDITDLNKSFNQKVA